MTKINSKKLNDKVNQVTGMVKERLTQEFTALERRFPKEVREELKAKVLTNLKETRVEVENRARVIAEKSRENPIVLKYLRPFVGSEKTGEVLTNLESRVSSAAPVLRKLQSLRQQFMDLTAPQTPEKNTETGEVTNEVAPKKKRAKRSEKTTED